MANYRIIMPTVESDITINYPTTGGTLALEGGGGGGGGFTFYDVTLADAENNAAPVNIATITVPANTWEDGQSITFDLAYDLLNNTGTTQSPFVFFDGSGITGYSYSGSWNSDGATWRQWVRMTVFRSGADVYTDGNLLSTTSNYVYPLQSSAMAFPSTAGLANDIRKSTGVNFTSDITIRYRIILNSASPDYWLRPWYGSAWKTEKGASL
jgi:hypothetical protein